MKTLFTEILPGNITYTGAELTPHWIARRTGVFASSIVAFRGPCAVKTEEMVDMEDRLAVDGVAPAGGTPAQFLAEIKKGIDMWSGVVRRLGLKAE